MNEEQIAQQLEFPATKMALAADEPDRATDYKHLQDFQHYTIGMRQMAKTTVKMYRGYCLQLIRHLHKRGVTLGTAKREDIEACLADRAAVNGVCPNSNRVAFYAMAHFCRFLALRGRVPTNPAAGIELPRGSKGLPIFFQEDEIALLIRNLPNQGDGFVGFRFRCMFLLLYASGIRISELVQIRLHDLRLKHRLVLIQGKGAKERLVTFSRLTARNLKHYLELRREWLAELGYQSDFIFPTWEGRPLATATVRRWMGKWAEEIRFGRPLRPHSIRHSFATHLMERGADIRMVQRMLGHGSLTSTQIYTHVTTGAMRNAYERCHPQGTGATA